MVGKSRSSSPRRWLLVVLATGLVLIDVAAILGIVDAHQRAELEALADLERQTAIQARSFETRLVELRGELIFLASSLRPPDPNEPDPMARRWQMRDLEANLLGFAASSPALELLAWRNTDSSAQVVVGRLGGFPVLFAPDAPRPFDPDGLVLELPSRQGTLTATVDPHRVLALTAPGLEDRLRLIRNPAPGLEPQVDSEETALADTLITTLPIGQSWPQMPTFWLERRERRAAALQSLDELTSRFRLTLGLNLVVVVLSLVLFAYLLESYRRFGRLEAERAQEARINELGRQLHHSERLSSLGHLSAALAHEINNPLAGLFSYLRLLERDLEDSGSEHGQERIAKIREGLERIAGVVRRALAGADPGRAAPTAIDLRKVVSETVEFVRGVADPTLRFEILLPEAPLMMLGQAVTLGQVFLNLLRNAGQAQLEAGNRGSIKVEVLKVDSRIAVRIADRGPGLPPEALATLFQPFSSSRGSLGLGLSVSRDIVEGQSGRISGRNRDDGPGAIFEVSFPELREK